MKPRMTPDRWVISATLRSSELLPAVGAGGGVTDSGGTLIINSPNVLDARQTLRCLCLPVKHRRAHAVFVFCSGSAHPATPAFAIRFSVGFAMPLPGNTSFPIPIPSRPFPPKMADWRGRVSTRRQRDGGPRPFKDQG